MFPSCCCDAIKDASVQCVDDKVSPKSEQNISTLESTIPTFDSNIDETNWSIYLA